MPQSPPAVGWGPEPPAAPPGRKLFHTLAVAFATARWRLPPAPWRRWGGASPGPDFGAGGRSIQQPIRPFLGPSPSGVPPSGGHALLSWGAVTRATGSEPLPRLGVPRPLTSGSRSLEPHLCLARGRGRGWPQVPPRWAGSGGEGFLANYLLPYSVALKSTARCSDPKPAFPAPFEPQPPAAPSARVPAGDPSPAGGRAGKAPAGAASAQGARKYHFEWRRLVQPAAPEPCLSRP